MMELVLNVVFYLHQVKDLTKFLDPSGLGVISFEDFHRGISAISNGGESPDALFKFVFPLNST